MAEAKTMSRSRNQLATSYAPESFFTFEGGLGACIAHSAKGDPIDLPDATKDQLFERIEELGRAWFETALDARANDPNNPPVLPAQCVDRSLLDANQMFALPGEGRFYLCKPSHMEYTPAPLTFVCRCCGLFRDYESLKALDSELESLSSMLCPKAPASGPHDWEQLDVIFVHWSGNWCAAFPGQFHWEAGSQAIAKRRSRCSCGRNEFRLNRRQAGIGDWFFECAAPGCGKPLSQKWLQNDEETLKIIGPHNYTNFVTHVRMEATPYRASSAYYVRADLFINFKDGGNDLLSRLRPGREEQLKDFIATTYGFDVTPIDDADVLAACQGREDCRSALLDYQTAVTNIAMAEQQLSALQGSMREMVRELAKSAYTTRDRVIADLRSRQILVPEVALPAGLVGVLTQRQQWFAPKFDPFRLAIEHATLKATRLDIERTDGGKKPYVSFARLDQDLSPESTDEKEGIENETRVLFEQLGLADMGLIRRFDLCKFSFGYSRMESGPVLRGKRGMDMPVRLNLFPQVDTRSGFKHPIYIVEQANEALYVRLNEQRVLAWLKQLECQDMFTLEPGQRVGAGVLSRTQMMSAFLDGLSQSNIPSIYYYVYSLLHSYSHLVMKHVSEYSGLDLGSLGEYIFPADLAFVVYRNGTTMDLGNLSAVWRNAGTALLASMLTPKATQCGTGSLCSHRGGACPDCLMVPETSCIAGNKLLSRSVLRSIGGRPRFDTRDGVTPGYFDFVTT